MNIPFYRIKTDIDIYTTEDLEIVDYLKSNDILPISEYDNQYSFIKCKCLIKHLEEYCKKGKENV